MILLVKIHKEEEPNSMAEKIVKLTLSDQIYNILQKDIIDGVIPLGGKLTNRELQERFQVSSTPVRDAIHKLFQNGLVEDVTKTGAQIISFDPDYSKEVNEFISALACEAMLMTAQITDQEHIAKELYRYQNEMIEAEDSNLYFEADINYHNCFFEHCGNRVLKETYERYDLIRILLTRYAIRTPEEKTATIRQHQAITEAYVSGSHELAKKLINKHYRYGIWQINDYFSRQ